MSNDTRIEAKIVRLVSGGTITIQLKKEDGGVLDLLPEDRDFLFTLVDEMVSYEKRNSSV